MSALHRKPRLRTVSRARARASTERGFTLTELMVVVVLVGILATVGVATFRRELAASQSSEASSVIQAIRGAQESYRAETQRYFDVSGSEDRWYPVNSFAGGRYHWQQPGHIDYARWRRLGASVNQPVQFRYLVHAGAPGGTLPTLQVDTITLPTPTDPWFVIQARADADGDSVYCDVVAASFNGELFIRNEGE